jgi:hypothetical protein
VRPTAHRQLQANRRQRYRADFTWSDDPDVHSAPGWVATFRLISAEEFTEARMRASELSECLQIATTTGRGFMANHRRTSSRPIIDVLEEMSFDVTFEPGTKSGTDEDSGQVPAVSGR